MNIVKIEHHSKEELLERMKRVSLLHQPDQMIYRESYVSLERMRLECITPAQCYVLKDALLRVRSLRWALREKGHDLFRMNGYLSIWLEGEEEPFDVLPPVVEESHEADGRVISILNDGMHRIYLARIEWEVPEVVYVRGIPKEKPYYAFPMEDGWSKVAIVDDLPEGYVKKWHRIKNYKTLYRDFNSAFQNVGGPRGHFTKKG